MKRLTPQLLRKAARDARLPKGFQLDIATVDDLPALLDVAAACFAYDVPDRRTLRYMLTQAHAAFFVFRHKGGIAGYVLAEAHGRRGTLYVNTVCVVPAWRQRGLGRCGYVALIDLLARSGYNALIAHVEVDNRAAIALMRSLDFETLERIENYYYDNGRASLKMRLARAA